MAKGMPSWLEDAVFYEIYPQSFNDSNNDGIGDLNGITAKLDYIKSLGCNAIWLNPCFESPFMDAGYDISDYYKIAPRYGTNADMKKLCAEAKRKGVKIFLDLVVGHTSIEHKWFKESCKAKKNKFSDWFIWTDKVWNSPSNIKNISGFAERDGNFVTNFFWCQPALNFGFAKPDPKQSWQLPVDHPAVKEVREEVWKIMKFWMDLGCDGFRVDMAGSLVKGDDDQAETMKFWQVIRKRMEKEYPETALVAEWANPARSIPGGFHMDFLPHFGNPSFTKLFLAEDNFFSKSGNGDITSFLESYLPEYWKTVGKGFMCLQTANHDMQRIAKGRDRDEVEAGIAFILAMPGVPYIYYGDEIAMKTLDLPSLEGGYSRTGSRTPMQWNDGANCGFSKAKADKLYLPVDSSKDRPTVAAEEKDKKSLLNAVRNLTKLRHSQKALQASGSFSVLYAEKGKYPFVFLRKSGDEKIVFAVNPSGKSVTASFECPQPRAPKLLAGRHDVELVVEDGSAKLKMDAGSYAFFQI